MSTPSPALHDDRYIHHLHEAECLAEQDGEWSTDDAILAPVPRV